MPKNINYQVLKNGISTSGTPKMKDIKWNKTIAKFFFWIQRGQIWLHIVLTKKWLRFRRLKYPKFRRIMCLKELKHFNTFENSTLRVRHLSD